MAVTGLLLFGFVVAHMLGNWQIFLGSEQLNVYAHKLKSMPELLWPARLGLLTIFVVHIGLAINLQLENRAARPVEYAYRDWKRATPASRTMLLSGMLILAFVAYHLAHFTLLWVSQPTGMPFTTTIKSGETVPDVYRMVIAGFSNPGIVAIYVLGQFVLALHLSHGMTSVFQSLGLTQPRYAKAIEWIGPLCGFAIGAGNIAMPVAVLLGFVK